MEVVLREDLGDDQLSWPQLGFLGLLIYACASSLWSCCWAVGKIWARWNTREEPIKMAPSCSSVGIQTTDMTAPSTSSLQEISEGEKAHIQDTPRRKTQFNNLEASSASSRSRSVILRDMAMRAQPIVKEMEIRKAGWELHHNKEQ